ncbi:type II secretion system protein GspD [Arcobacter sp. LA11]|uniref:type II secretion system protein GspD n=1 Tax=Arcobacter sp. LA11 TaxID=1898176 RepID=UPI000932F2D2|nr:secretin N-terminal domain-containing protein [Arcobacter sp. LA11]
MKYILLVILFVLQVHSNNDLININFKNLKIMELIKITSKKINKSILVTKEIKGKVDFISNEPIKKENLLSILKYSLEDNGYSLVESGNILRVIKSDVLLNKITIKEKSSKKVKRKIDIVKYDDEIVNSTEVISLINIEAKSLENILKTLISQRKYKNNRKPSIAIDEENNSIIIDGIKDDVNNLKYIIRKLDVIKSQVYVKAKIVEVDDNLVEDIGFRFGILGGKVHSGGLNTFSSNLNGGNAIAIDTSLLGLKIPNVSSSLALGASLSLLNKTYALDIISEPSILCLNNKESSIYVGETVSIQTASTTTDGGTTKNSFQREDIGLTLKVKPRISSKNKVILDINTIIEGIKNTNSVNFNPDTSKKEVKTTAIVNNGESVIIGGLIENKNEKSIEKIPIASEIPLIGELFKNRLENRKNKNLIVIVTPYIIPKNKDLTYVRNELSKLKSLEDKFLENVLVNLKNKKKVKVQKVDLSKKITDNQRHEEAMKEYFGI